MKLLDILLGRTKGAQPDLERLFRMPSAALGLQSSYGLVSTGQAGVCYKREAGRAFAATHQEITQLLGLGDGPDEPVKVREETDSYGYSWIVIEADDFERLVNLVHVVNGTLGEEGFGTQLLCSVFAFGLATGTSGSTVATPDPLDIDSAGILDPSAAVGTWAAATPVYVVYLFKQGTFYPFVPLPGERQDLEAAFLLAGCLGDDLIIESDLERRFPIWGVPVH